MGFSEVNNGETNNEVVNNEINQNTGLERMLGIKSEITSSAKEKSDFVKEKLQEIKDKLVGETGSEGKEMTDNGEASENTAKGLTEAERESIKEDSGWSNEVVDNIESVKAYEIYKEAGNYNVNIEGREYLIRDIDLNKVDDKGRTNSERMLKGKAPIDPSGKSYELHHVGQHTDSPLAALTFEEHKGNDTILHDKSIKTEVHGEGNKWHKERSQAWKDIGEYLRNQGGN